MRIAHVTATFPPYQGGTGNVCYYSAIELVCRGHQVHVFTAAHPPGEYEYPETITVHRLPVAFRFGNAPFLPGLLKIKDFDVIHLHYPFIFGAELIYLVSKFRQIPYVITHHNDLIGLGLRRYLFDVYSRIVGRTVFRGASKFAAVSLGHAADSRMTSVLRERWGDVIEVPNGVDTNLFNPGVDGGPIRLQYGIDPQDQVILFVGALDRAHHFKRLDYLLQAFSQIKNPNVDLLVVGDGDLKDRFIAQANDLGITDHIHFSGSIPHQQLPPFFAAADVVVLPSFPPESFGMVLLEAMACAKPVIAHNIPGVRSVVSDDHDGLLAQPGDLEDLISKIQYLINDPEIALRMGANGRHKVNERYVWSQVVDRLEYLYRQVLAVTPSSRNAPKDVIVIHD